MSDLTPFSGADLSNYREELSKGRSIRTLTLRRVNRPTILGSVGVASNSVSQNRVYLSKSPIDNDISVLNVISVFSSNNENAIINMCQRIFQHGVQMPRVLAKISKSEEIVDSLIQFLNGAFSSVTKCSILSAIAVLFPLQDDFHEKYIDEGLCYTLIDFLSSNDTQMISDSVSLITIITKYSSYARDSVICLGIHDMLLNLALNQSDEIAESCCDAIYNVFAHSEEIELGIIQQFFEPLKALLTLNCFPALRIVLLIFSELAAHNPSIVYSYHQIGLYESAVSYLKTPDLVQESLRLISALALGKREHIQIMLDNGLFEQINMLGEDENLRPDVLWIISNLLDSSSPLILPYINEQFIVGLIESSMNSSYDVRKESAYLLSTIILNISFDILYIFLSTLVVECLSEMISCGVSDVVLRCIEALLRLVYFTHINSDNGQFLAILLESELSDHLTDILSSRMEQATEKASLLLSFLNIVRD